MLILSLESSAKPASVAVYDKNEQKHLGQNFQNNGFSHSRTLMSMTEALLKNLEIKSSEIGQIAVSNGPGSFTGVRIGVSAAKGLAMGLDIPVCGVSTLEAMAYQIPDYTGILCPVMDARRNQVYNALFQWKDNTLIRQTEDRAISIDDLINELFNYESDILISGDGTNVFNSYIQEKNIDLSYKITSELLRYQTAYGVAIASLHKKSGPAAVLEPCYLRPSQAERELSHSSIK